MLGERWLPLADVHSGTSIGIAAVEHSYVLPETCSISALRHGMYPFPFRPVVHPGVTGPSRSRPGTSASVVDSLQEADLKIARLRTSDRPSLKALHVSNVTLGPILGRGVPRLWRRHSFRPRFLPATFCLGRLSAIGLPRHVLLCSTIDSAHPLPRRAGIGSNWQTHRRRLCMRVTVFVRLVVPDADDTYSVARRITE